MPRRAGREGAGSRTMAAAAAGPEGRRAALEAAAAAGPERGGGSCVLCCGDLEATALGRCDHPVCYRCSTKMRVLCEQRYCAVCREELRQVGRAGRAARRGTEAGAGARPGGAAWHPAAGRGLCLSDVRLRPWWRRLPKERPGRATWGGVPILGPTVGGLGLGDRRWPNWFEEADVPGETEPGDFSSCASVIPAGPQEGMIQADTPRPAHLWEVIPQGSPFPWRLRGK